MNKARMGLREALHELWATLADCWQEADLGGHLAAWANVVSGRVDVDAHTPRKREYLAYHAGGQTTVKADSFSEAWEKARTLYPSTCQVVQWTGGR